MTTSPVSSDLFHVGALQYDVRTGDIRSNLEQIADVLNGQQPSDTLDLLVLPEMALTGFDYHRLAELAELVPEALTELCKVTATSARLIALTIPVRSGSSVFNRLLLIPTTKRNEDSSLIFYDKIHCIGHGGFRETDFITPGSETKVAELGKWRIGLSVCYDLRFPELYRQLQSDLILLPAQWPASRHEHLLCLVRARAIENQSCLILCNRTGRSGDLDFKGNSQIIDARGDVLADAGQQSGMIRAMLDHRSVSSWREQFPVLKDVIMLQHHPIRTS